MCYDIANLVKSKVGAQVVVTESNDPRSYNKILQSCYQLATRPQSRFRRLSTKISTYNQGILPDGENCYTVRLCSA